ncbi:MAG TPA: hypothetical protein VGX76_06600, partial [Pirellulales bacterium]|nr:hypothetical protein [Pirellulales bacterium]
GAWVPGYGQPSTAPGFQAAPGFQGPVSGGVGYPPGIPGASGYAGAFVPAPALPGQAAFEPFAAEQGVAGAATGASDVDQAQAVQFSAAAPAAEPPPDEPAPPSEKQEPRIVRIACPQGHELQTPMDMIGQEVLCPFCNAQFVLLYENSVEFKEEQAELERLREERLNRTALQWAIIAALVVVLGIISMMVYLALRSHPTAHVSAISTVSFLSPLFPSSCLPSAPHPSGLSVDPQLVLAVRLSWRQTGHSRGR